MFEQHKDTILKCIDALDSMFFDSNDELFNHDDITRTAVYSAWENLINTAKRLGYYDEQNEEVE